MIGVLLVISRFFFYHTGSAFLQRQKKRPSLHEMYLLCVKSKISWILVYILWMIASVVALPAPNKGKSNMVNIDIHQVLRLE